MNRAVYILTALLLFQLALVARLYWPDRAITPTDAKLALADIGPFLIDEIRIADGNGAEAVLTREGGLWTIGGDLPADPLRVDKLLEQLTATDPGWPVARTEPARQRFQVAPYHFRRRVELRAQNQKIAGVFLGTSPGFRRVHARNEQRDEIFSISLNLFEISPSADQWLDGSLLQVRAPLRIVADRYRLDRSGGEWRGEGGETPDPRELEALLAALRSLQVTAPASEAARDELAFAEAAVILEVESLGGTVSLEFYELGGEHYVISSQFERPFLLSPYSFDQVTGLDARLLSGAQ